MFELLENLLDSDTNSEKRPKIRNKMYYKKNGYKSLVVCPALALFELSYQKVQGHCLYRPIDPSQHLVYSRYIPRIFLVYSQNMLQRFGEYSAQMPYKHPSHLYVKGINGTQRALKTP